MRRRRLPNEKQRSQSKSHEPYSNKEHEEIECPIPKRHHNDSQGNLSSRDSQPAVHVRRANGTWISPLSRAETWHGECEPCPELTQGEACPMSYTEPRKNCL